MPLTKKAMVLFDDEQYKKLEEYARSHHVSVGKIIRDSVNTVILKKGNVEKRIQAAVRLTSAEEDTVDWDEFEKTITKGHAR